MDRVILHCDMNNFYASVEAMLNPALKGLPIAVCGSAEERHGIVLAKSEAAKACGVSTGEAIWQAKQKCPALVTVPPHYEEYARVSRAARRIYERYTDEVEPFGMDECWLDCTGSTRLFGSGEEIAERIRREISSELGVTVSIGVSFNKIFAKLGSDMKKPDAITVIPRESFREMIWGLPVTDLLGVGGATGKKLLSFGIRTIGDLALFPEAPLVKALGKCGTVLRRYAMGLDFSSVTPHTDDSPDQSVGHGITTAADLVKNEEVEAVMQSLTEEIGQRLFLYGKRAEGVSISVRDSRLRTKEWQCPLALATQSPRIIAREAFRLFVKNYGWEEPLRSVTVRAIRLTSSEAIGQISMFDELDRDRRYEAADRAVFGIRRRFGGAAIRSASVLAQPKLPDARVRSLFPGRGASIG